MPDKRKGEPAALARKRIEMQIQEKILLLSRMELRLLEIEEETKKLEENQTKVEQDKVQLEEDLKNIQ